MHLFTSSFITICQEDAKLDFQGQLSRNAVRDKERLWEDAIIPFSFSYSFTTDEKAVVMEAMEEFHERTCIR